MSAREIIIHNRKPVPINGSASGPSLNLCPLLATGALICVEPLLPHDILSFRFLSQYHPHDEFRIRPSTLLEPNFVGHLDHFVTCVHAEVIHPPVNETDEGTIFWGLFVEKK